MTLFTLISQSSEYFFFTWTSIPNNKIRMTAVKFHKIKNTVFLLAYDKPIYIHKYLVLEENKMYSPLIFSRTVFQRILYRN